MLAALVIAVLVAAAAARVAISRVSRRHLQRSPVYIMVVMSAFMARNCSICGRHRVTLSGWEWGTVGSVGMGGTVGMVDSVGGMQIHWKRTAAVQGYFYVTQATANTDTDSHEHPACICICVCVCVSLSVNWAPVMLHVALSLSRWHFPLFSIPVPPIVIQYIWVLYILYVLAGLCNRWQSFHFPFTFRLRLLLFVLPN